MPIAQCPALERGTFSSTVSMVTFSQVMVSKFKTANVLVHFHSLSVVAFESFTTKGTQPPKTYILLLTIVALCNDRGSGALPRVQGFDQVMVSMSNNHKSPKRQPLIPPYIKRYNLPVDLQEKLTPV
ncbi:hypothetical protein CVS40_0594 [Lucilia cuprina]|nr:hypothetical protein CVS40_0594 [Lucilia cuprina]